MLLACWMKNMLPWSYEALTILGRALLFSTLTLKPLFDYGLCVPYCSSFMWCEPPTI